MEYSSSESTVPIGVISNNSNLATVTYLSAIKYTITFMDAGVYGSQMPFTHFT
jgi:hypothetical protein